MIEVGQAYYESFGRQIAFNLIAGPFSSLIIDVTRETDEEEDYTVLAKYAITIAEAVQRKEYKKLRNYQVAIINAIRLVVGNSDYVAEFKELSKEDQEECRKFLLEYLSPNWLPRVLKGLELSYAQDRYIPAMKEVNLDDIYRDCLVYIENVGIPKPGDNTNQMIEANKNRAIDLITMGYTVTSDEEKFVSLVNEIILSVSDSPRLSMLSEAIDLSWKAVVGELQPEHLDGLKYRSEEGRAGIRDYINEFLGDEDRKEILVQEAFGTWDKKKQL